MVCRSSIQQATYHSAAGNTHFLVKKLAESGKPIFLRWEKLRVLFIGLCSAFSIFAMYKQQFWPDTLEHWIVLIGGAFVANVLYLAGPIVESYLKWLEYPYQMVGNSLFLAGTAVTCMLAWWTIEGLKELPTIW